jgi:ABC-type oligopeptide transport system ATPase subunit
LSSTSRPRRSTCRCRRRCSTSCGDLQDEFGLTYLFISHDLAVVRHMADNVGVLHNGVLVEEGPVDEIFDNPRADYTRMLLDAVPDISKVH